LAALSDRGGRHEGDANMVARPRGGDARGAWAEGRNIGRLAPQRTVRHPREADVRLWASASGGPLWRDERGE
jgi:hypothetical protein